MAEVLKKVGGLLSKLDSDIIIIKFKPDLPPKKPRKRRTKKISKTDSKTDIKQIICPNVSGQNSTTQELHLSDKRFCYFKTVII